MPPSSRRTNAPLLKLDLQGHELIALAGAKALLSAFEVVVTEVSFFHQAGFDLFDVAALSGRTRDDRLRRGDFIFVRRGSVLSCDTNWS